MMNERLFGIEAERFSVGMIHKIVPAGNHGSAKIVHDSPDMIMCLRARWHGQPLDCEKYCRLFVDGQVWMSDTQFEWRTNLEAIRRLTGDVLLGGLGIGFVLAPILPSDSVKSVTVIEKSADVIALVAPQFHSEKLHVIHADVFDWQVPRRTFDSIYIDVFPNVPNLDDLPAIKKLKCRYRPGLRKGGWLGVWCESFARR